MKYIKTYKLFESKDIIQYHLDDIQNNLKDIFIDLIDDGYDINFYKRKAGVNKQYEYGVNILLDENILFNTELSDTLKTAVSFMNDLEFKYESFYYTYHSLPQKFYIYLDDRGLRSSGNKMNETWPNCFKITLNFYI
jgi:hypothetical protein